MQERHRQPHALFHAGGELAHFAASGIGQPDQLEHFGDAFFVHAGRQARSQIEVIPGGEIRHEGGRAQQRADIL